MKNVSFVEPGFFEIWRLRHCTVEIF
jgi:hypothetical protein